MSVDGSSVRASLSIPQAVLEEMAAEPPSTVTAAVAAAQPAAPVRKREPKPRTGGKITVHGTTGGPRGHSVHK